MTVESGDVLRCTQEMHYDTFGAIQNVYHLQNIGSTVTNVQALADVIEVLEALAAFIATAIAVLQVVDGVRVINATQHTDVGFGLFVDTTPFTGSGEVEATQLALGLNLYTERLGVIGRKYFGAVVTGGLLDGGLLNSGPLLSLADVGDEMTELQAATNSDWRFGVIASFDSEFLEFESYSIPTMAIVQRRRRLGVGI